VFDYGLDRNYADDEEHPEMHIYPDEYADPDPWEGNE